MVKTIPPPDAQVQPPQRRPRREKPPTLEGQAGFAPSMPTTGADLVAQWQLPPAAWREGRLKINRKIFGSNASELLAESSVEDFNLAGLARDFGPGDFYLFLSPHPARAWGQHNCKVSVSPQYASAQGYQAYPVERPPVLPRLADAEAMRHTAAALARPEPIDSSNLALLVESVVERTIRSLPAHNPVLPGQGMGFHDAMQFFQSMDHIREVAEEKAEKRILALMGRGSDDDEAPKEQGFTELIAQAIPGILKAFTPQPAPAPPAPPASAPVQAPTLAPPQVQEDEMFEVPLTPEEAQQFSLAVGMLQPFAPRILAMLQQTQDDQAIAAELASFVPFPLKGQLVKLAALGAERGSGVLGLIDPDLMTDRGLSVLQKMGVLLS